MGDNNGEMQSTDAQAQEKGQVENSVLSDENRERQLANLRPWQPGQSGNPGGRPKKPITILSEAIREKLKDSYDDGKTFAEAIADRLVNEALKSQFPVQAIKEVGDRSEGKASQPIAVEGELTYSESSLSNLSKEELLALESIARKLAVSQ